MGTDESTNKKENAPHNPLSPHADDPAWEPGPPKDGNGHGGEYDQQTYRARAGETGQTPEKGEYDRDAPRKNRDDSQ